MLPESFDPHTSNDPQQLTPYFLDLGFTAEEIPQLIVNWSRSTPQTDEEVREGVLAERTRRDSATDERMNKE
jgi:hypothetical protein